ncbi:LacI family DNA-binding transcriptional regulator [Lacticaseibacillus salsurivasis]|uniref:LacI family DNA-binding transcriptional regulator n=1 Tax=Lacticaseibacillus salsurivasis TaxID=3081441 RepID=UPI0030C6C3EE
MTTTINEVAAAAGVSKSTISRYLTGQFDRMSPATRQRIAAVIAELGYVPNHNASALRSKRSHQIGVVVGDVSNVYSTFLIKGIAAVTHDHGDQILIADGGEDPTTEAQALASLVASNVDGIILQPARGQASVYEALRAAGLPVVLVDRVLAPLTFPCVTSNDQTASTALADAVVAKGYQRILVISQPVKDASVRAERYEGFKAAAQAAGASVSLLEVGKDGTVAGIKPWLAANAGHHPAIFAANGNLLMASLRWLQAHGVAVPEAVGLCGYDDWNWGELANPALSVLDQHPEQIGRVVAERLVALMSGEAVPVARTEIPATLHLRASL